MFWTGMHDTYEDGARVWVHDPPSIERRYPYEWQAAIFRPAGMLESALSGARVEIVAASR